MAYRKVNNVPIENAQIIFRNFKGEENRYNRKGDRNFCVFLDDKLADRLTDEGWNVKILRPRDEQDEARNYIKVNVEYRKGRPPRIYTIKGKVKTLLNEETVSNLDSADITHIDMEISPYNWEMNGRSGINAYLKVMYVTLEEDAFASKYEFLDEDDEFIDVSDEQLPF